MKTIALITGNESKRREAALILAPHGIAIESVALKLDEPRILDQQLVVRAKAEQAYATLRRPVIVDDTGLCLEEYGEFPGSLTNAFYAAVGLQGVLRLVNGGSRRAFFRTLICYKDAYTTEVFEGRWSGTIAQTPHGEFNPDWQYNGIFIPDGFDVPLAEIALEERSKHSHRRQALEQLAAYVKPARRTAMTVESTSRADAKGSERATTIHEISVPTIGEAWLAACKAVLAQGENTKDGDEPIRELRHLFVQITAPSADAEQDPILTRHGDKQMIAWMLSNFREQKRVPELKNAHSYGTRLYNYAGKDQVAWVVEKLRKKPETKSATIPMLWPAEDDGYVPCVSLLDFKIRDGELVLTAFCRSIDIGKKSYANLLALRELQERVAKELAVPAGPLIFDIVSAHVYEKDRGSTILEAAHV